MRRHFQAVGRSLLDRTHALPVAEIRLQLAPPTEELGSLV